ncbi:hypothetical protein ACTXT7_015250 [Hymenolepis weldensis]
MNPKELSNFVLVRTVIDAIYQKDIEELDKILSKNFIANLCDHRCQTFLQWAASYGTPEIVELIYSKLSDNCKHDPMALTLAMLLRRMNICRTLLQHREVISERDITEILQRAHKLTKEEKKEVETLMTAAKEKNRTKPGMSPQTNETKMPREGGNSNIFAFKFDFVPKIALILTTLPTEKIQFQQNNPKIGESQSKSSIVAIRRIAVHLILQLIRILPEKYMLFISDLKFHGRYLCQWLCELISTSLAHDDGLTIEESVVLFNELFNKSPKFYHELSKRCDFITLLERFRSIIEFGTNNANCIISSLLKTSHLRFHGWSFFGLGEDLVIYNEMVICVIGNNSRDKTTYGYIYTSGKGTEIVTFSSPVRTNKCKGMEYRLLCLVDFIRQNNPEREIGKDRRIPEEGTSEGSVKHIRLSPSISNALSPNTTHIWRTKEQTISIGEFNLESFQSENGEFFLRVNTCNKNFLLFSEWPNYTFYCVDECPNQIKIEEGTPINHLSEMDQLDALKNRREVFLSIFSHKPAFSKLIQCIKTAFEESEHLPLYLFSYLHTLRPVLDNNSGPFVNADGTVDAENCILPEKGGIEGSIQFHILRLLSSWLYTRRSSDKYELYDPLFTWNIELNMTDFSELIILAIKNQFSIIQALKNHPPNLLAIWYVKLLAE